MAEALREKIGSKSAISLELELVDPNFQVEGVAPTNHSSSPQKTRPNDLSYGMKIWTNLSSVLSQCTRLADRQTDTFLIASSHAARKKRRFRSNEVSLTQNFRENGSPATNYSSCHKTGINDLSCGISKWAEVSVVLSQSTRLTDRQTAFSWLDSDACNACSAVKTTLKTDGHEKSERINHSSVFFS